MKRITTGDLAAAIRSIGRSIVTDDMVRVWAERGLIPADRNPGNDRGWWYVMPDSLQQALRDNVGLMPDEVDGILRALRLVNVGTQLRLVSCGAKKSESQDVNLLIGENLQTEGEKQINIFSSQTSIQPPGIATDAM